MAVITVPLELAEYWILSRIMKRADYQNDRVRLKILLASFVQTSGLAFSMVLVGLQSDGLRVLSWAFLLGAAMNSMLSARVHPGSHRVRLGVLGVAAVVLLVHAYTQHQADISEFASEVSAVVAMIFMVWYLFSHLTRRADRMYIAERALIVRSEEATRLALVAEHASDSIVLMDENRQITWANTQFTQLTGYPLQEALGHSLGQLLDHPNTDRNVINTLVSTVTSGKPANARIRNQTKDGMTLWVETHQTPVFDDDGTICGFIAVERDVSDVVKREKELRNALRAAKEADYTKTAFLSRMSHELRTPANGLYGGMEMLRETDLGVDQEEALAILETSSNRLMQLLENIVTVADVEAGTVKVDLRPMNINDVLNQVADQYVPRAMEKNITFQIDVDPSAGASIVSDPELIGQILDKLMSNSMKFTKSGQITLHVYAAGKNKLHVDVKDTGIGIEKSKLPRIFDAFEQADKEKTRNFDGAGLGLSTARELARLLGAQISATSTLGKGSCFTLALSISKDETTPLNKPKASDFAAPMAAPGPDCIAQPVLEHMRLLVAEDNRTNRLLIKSMLKDAGHDLEFAEDGSQAVERYARAPYDFVLMDLSMPNKNGLDATREIRALEASKALRRCPIVAVTANVSEEDRRMCFEAGMDEFLAKPLRKERLLQTIGTVLATFESRREPLH